MGSTPHKTPLYDAHLKLQARMVDFHGWIMPIQYTGVLEEHAAVRNKIGLFDLSHMGRVRITGKDRRAFLQKLLTIDVDKTEPGRCRYTFLLTERGTIIDDLIYYAAPGPDEDRLVINASNREKDLEWMTRHVSGDVTLEDRTFSTALLAVQGPESPEIVKKALGVDPSALKYYTSGTFGDYFISRTVSSWSSWRGCLKASRMALLVISLKTTRSTVMPSSLFCCSRISRTCQEMASPSRSGSVARYR